MMTFDFGKNRKIQVDLERITRDYLEKTARAVNGVELPVLHLARSPYDKSYIIGLMDESCLVVVKSGLNNVGSLTYGAEPYLAIDVPLDEPNTLDRLLQCFNELPETIEDDDSRAWNALALCSKLRIRLPYPGMEHLWPNSDVVQIMAGLYFE